MKHYILFIILLLCGTVSANPIINARLEPATAHVGETVQLILTLDNAQTSHMPDLAPLQKDFIITGTQASLSYSAINGVAKSTNTWVIQLIAKKSGVLSVPPIQIGHLSSTPTQINITEQANEFPLDNEKVSSDENAPVLLRTKINPTKPFINEEVIYTVRLYSRQSLLEADYQPPHVDDALLIPLGEGRRYQTTLNNTRYNVDEQQYAIFPQKSGQLQITPPTLTAVVYNDNVAKHIRIKGNATPLNVAPIPTSHTSPHWLPAQQVGLTERFEPSTTNLVQGDTIVRTIRLQAMAMPAELLPALTFSDSKQFSVYPEKPETHNSLRQQTLIGTTITKVTYLLNQAGTITLPPLNFTWFNTKTGREETISLPAHELTVTPKPSPVISSPAQSNHVAQKKSTVVSRLSIPKQSHRQLYWLIAVITGAIGLLMILSWWCRAYILKRRPLKIILKRLQNACTMNDPTSAHQAYVSWLTVQKIKVVSDPELNKQLQILSQVLYSAEKVKWDGLGLWLAVKNYQPTHPFKKPSCPLPPIHPL